MFKEITLLYSLYAKYGQFLPVVIVLFQDIENEISNNSEPNIAKIASDFTAGIGAVDPNFPTGDVVDIEADIQKLFDDITAKKAAAPATTV
jgi:hypothetical protein